MTINYVVKGLPKLDLDLYIQNYTGYSRFERLLHIGTHCKPLSLDALKGAIAEAKSGSNVHKYAAAWDVLRKVSLDEPDAIRDDAWMERTDAENRAEVARLEKQLKVYKNNLIKESIRMGHEDLGKHFERIGSLVDATEAYTHMRQDITTTKHIIDCSMRLISVSLQRHDWSSVIGYVNKISGVQSTLSGEDENVMVNFHRVVMGVAQMCRGDYDQAARSLLECQFAVPANTYSHVASPNDVAVYGGLLSLATMDRSDLQTKVLDNQSFRTFLETEPHVRKAISSFVSGRYTSCLAILESFRDEYLLDIYLFHHVGTLYSQIRRKCIVQYFKPFSCVTIDILREAFGQPDQPLEKELIGMVRDGALKARIDAKNGLLVAVRPDSRQQMQQNALAAAHRYEEEAQQALRRISIISAGLEVPSIRKQDNSSSVLDEQWQEESPAAYA